MPVAFIVAQICLQNALPEAYTVHLPDLSPPNAQNRLFSEHADTSYVEMNISLCYLL